MFRIYLGIGVLTILLIVGCGKRESEKFYKINFGVDIATIAAAPVYIAESKGFWTQNSLEVTIQPFVSGRFALDALIGKAVEAATVADVPVVLAAYQRHPVRIVATFSNSEKHINMLARKDKGIHKPEDLKGKKVAVTVGTNGEFVMDLFLERYRIKRSELRVVSLSPPDMVPAIIEGKVDAIFTWQPHIYNAQKKLADNALVVSTLGIYSQPFNVVVLEDLLIGGKEKLERLLKGLNAAEKFIKTNRTESIEIVAKQIGVENATIENIWDAYTFEIGIDSSLVELLEEEGKWAKRAGIVQQDNKEPEYGKLVYKQILLNVE